MKIDLLPPKAWTGWSAPDSHREPIKRSLPYFRSAFGEYVHRIRSGQIYFWDGEYSHTALHLWCGMSGLLSLKRHSKNRIIESPSPHDVVCATCEGRAIGSGQTGSRTIADQMVRFSPRV